MKIFYNVAGASRKASVSAVSQELGTASKYRGAPSFAFSVSGYTIDKNGTLEGEDNPSLVADLQGLHGFIAVASEYDFPLPEAKPVPEGAKVPYEASLGGTVSPYSNYEEPPVGNTPDRLTIEVPADGFTESAFTNLQNLVSSKETLIKKALGADSLPIERKESTIKFPWFTLGSSDDAQAYTVFITSLCNMAKTQKRVNKTEKPMAENFNYRYAMRCFLLRLGFIGSDYKEERRVLLSKLSGSSAFKEPADKNGNAK